MTTPATTMLRLARRGVRASLGRLVLTTIAVVAGVGFVAGSFILADSLGDTFDAFLESDSDTPDAQIQLTELEFGRDDRAIPDTIVAEVAALPEVAKAEPQVVLESVDQFAVVEDGGDQITPGFGRIIFATDWEAQQDEGFSIVDGVAPVGTDQVAIDSGYAGAAGVGVGDRVTLDTVVGQRRFDVAAIVDIADLGGHYVLLFDFPTTQVLFDKEGEVDLVDLTSAPGVSTDEMVAAVEAVLPEQATVRSFEELIADLSAEVEAYLAIARNVLLGFAGVALFVSLFIISNTFAILVTQRLQQIGMLRAVGATKGQIRAGVIFEALLIGLVGGLVGLGFGYGIAAVLQAIIERVSGFDSTTVVAARTVVVAMVVAVGATTVSALVPSFLAGRVTPVAAMRNEVPTRSSATRRIAAGGGVLALGLGLVGAGLFGDGQGTTTLVAELAIGSMLTFIGVALLSVLFAGPVVDFIGRPPVLGGGLTALGVALPLLMFTQGAGTGGIMFVPKMAVSVVALVTGLSILATWLRGGRRTGLGGSAGGLAGQLARQNAARSPRRTAATATALTIGIALVSAFGVVGQSLQATQNDIVSRAVKADLFVTSASTGSSSRVSSEVADRLEVTPGLAEVSRVRYNEIRVDGNVEAVAAYEASTGDRLIDLAVSEGSVDGLLEGGLLVYTDTAVDRSLGVGDPVTVEFPDNETEQLVVAGIFDDNAIEREWVVDLSVFERHVSSTDDDIVAVSFAAGVDAEAATAEVEALADEIGSYEVLNAAEITEEIESQLNMMVTVINALLGLTLFVAFLGVVNTIVLSVIERTREVGLLRAVGMTRSQIRGTVRWESVMVCLFGAALGIGLGVVFAWAAVSAIPDGAIAEVAIPFESVLFTVLATVLAGVLAAVVPARRAAKLDVLDAIATAG